MKFFEQICLIVLPEQQVLPHKGDGQMSFFWSLLIAEGGLYAKIYIV